jgi:hypothetical protein
MTVITPCRECSKPIYGDGSEGPSPLCDTCKGKELVEEELEHQALMARFDVGLAVVTHGTYHAAWDPTVTQVEVSDTLKEELVEALELGANVPDGEQVRLTLILSSVRRPE